MRIYKDDVTNAYFYWYAPYEMTFQREHNIFAFEHYELLAQNKYPPTPTGAFTEIQITSTIRPSWNSPLNIKAELDFRLRTTGKAGETLIWEVQQGLDSYELLCPEAKRVLNYISGWYRRKMPFRKWCWQEDSRGY